MPRIVFDLFAVNAPPGWIDITDTVGSPNTPDTLALPDGVGVLQFSVALYQSGPVPDPTPAVLQDMVWTFGQEKGLGEPSAVVAEPGPPILAAGSFDWGEDFVRVWQVAADGHFAFVTYVCRSGNKDYELSACEQTVRSIAFGGRSRSRTPSLFPDDG